jgi:hypothetical protein
MKKIYDKKGIPIHVGDVVKIYHFRAALRREKIYMYKQVKGVLEYPNHTIYVLDHLMENRSTFTHAAENQIERDWEIVQGYNGGCHSDRDRVNAAAQREFADADGCREVKS